ncbi:MAG: hypothetical protein M1829_006864 [Trizodia sp. TS-e1964]|nr:MAG: hypothetical protein M1829_006864 [Trizodia sp. TS-e1964]
MIPQTPEADVRAATLPLAVATDALLVEVLVELEVVAAVAADDELLAEELLVEELPMVELLVEELVPTDVNAVTEEDGELEVEDEELVVEGEAEAEEEEITMGTPAAAQVS